MRVSSHGVSTTSIFYWHLPGPANKTNTMAARRSFLARFKVYETHGGEDVPVYAIGPGSHLFSGTVEQNYIPHAIAHAACIAEDNSHCEKPPSDDACAAAPGLATTPISLRPLGQVPPAVEDEKQQTRDQWAWSTGTRTWTWTIYQALTLLMLLVVLMLR
ncbi:Alkaline phosphatase, tissue-nonspecific isozyme [Chionoecetes opilio]|uniref:alkaline phosphatase n=1 Tax=Chionoecetes opilio TaxID=41210 RepID=A0A8J5CHN1_CHIOP|nr:Alkaline phosphatase, tissue-nonspecific isozyme [Chionoecetes opilio]